MLHASVRPAKAATSWLPASVDTAMLSGLSATFSRESSRTTYRPDCRFHDTARPTRPFSSTRVFTPEIRTRKPAYSPWCMALNTV
eukprot:6357487-Prymnesium_polylepis.3